MKKPLKTRKPLLFYNIPIFGTCLYLIFFQSQWLLNTIPILLLFFMSISFIYIFITQKTAKQHAMKQSFISILSLLSTVPIAFIFLYTPCHYLLRYHPQYLTVIPPLQHYFLFALSICILLTTSLAIIFNDFYFNKNASGALKNTLVTYFNAPLAWETTLELFSAFPIQVLLLSYLSIAVLSLTQVIAQYFNLQLATGISIPLLVVIYAFLMLIKLPFWKSALRYLEEKHYNTGHIYLLFTGIALFVWLLINIVISTLPQSLFAWFHQHQLLIFSQPSTLTSWLILLIGLSLSLPLLLATLLVRLQRNHLTCLNLPFALIISLSFYMLEQNSSPIFYLPTWLNLFCLLTMISLISFSYCYIIGNQINLVGFLENKTQLKVRRPVKHLIPSLQGIFILIGVYAFGGIYGMLFPIYLATMPVLPIIIVTLICYPLLKYKYHDRKKYE